MRHRTHIAFALGAAWAGLEALGAAPAVAQSPGLAGEGLEGWGLVEIRVPWSGRAGGPWPHSLRLINDFRQAPRVGGLQHALARGGPVWNLHPDFSFATNLTAGIELPRLGAQQSEYRLELEPTWRQRWGPLALVQRGRAEWRVFPSQSRLRLRAQVRATWHQEGWPLLPFVSQEAFVEPTNLGFNQNRLQLGASWRGREDSRLDLGYLWRPRLSAEGWSHDHALMLTLFFAPDMQALLDDEAGD